jgi:molybdopterin-binding protein
MENFNKSEKQLFFNQLKGCIAEIEFGEKFSNLTLQIGHANFRSANFCMKSSLFTDLIEGYNVGDSVSVRYYISSNKKNGRWYTTATLLSIENIEKN